MFIMAIDLEKERRSGTVEQRVVYESGNEMAAYAAARSIIILWGTFRFPLPPR